MEPPSLDQNVLSYMQMGILIEARQNKGNWPTQGAACHYWNALIRWHRLPEYLHFGNITNHHSPNLIYHHHKQLGTSTVKCIECFSPRCSKGDYIHAITIGISWRYKTKSYLLAFKINLWTKTFLQAWFHRLHDYLVLLGIKEDNLDQSLFTFIDGNIKAYFLVYIDDIVITSSLPEFIT